MSCKRLCILIFTNANVEFYDKSFVCEVLWPVVVLPVVVILLHTSRVVVCSDTSVVDNLGS